MKKHIITLIAIIAIFSACKKDAINSGKNGKNTVPVNFNIGYTQSTGTFNVSPNGSKLGTHTLASVDPTLAANAKVLYIAIYGSDGSRLYLTKQLSTDTVFGKAQYNLPPGTYTVAFAAGQNNLIYNGTALANDNFNYSGTTGWQDTFFQKETLTVGASGINQSVTLERIVSQIIVNIEDAIPSNVTWIQVALGSSQTSGQPVFGVNAGAALGNSTGTIHIPTGQPIVPGTKNTKFSFIVLSTAIPYTVQILADATPGGQTIGYAFITSVATQAGHQTTVAGQLFGGNGMTNTGGFQATIDPVWDPTTTTIPFQ